MHAIGKDLALIEKHLEAVVRGEAMPSMQTVEVVELLAALERTTRIADGRKPGYTVASFALSQLGLIAARVLNDQLRLSIEAEREMKMVFGAAGKPC